MTIFLEKKIEIFTKVAWWIIVLTVVALLLILAVFAYLLWKVKYFLYFMSSFQKLVLKLYLDVIVDHFSL